MKSMINEDIEFSKGLPIPYKVYVTNDKGFIKSHAIEIAELIRKSYNGENASIQSADDVVKANIAKIVVNNKGQIISLALYKDTLGGHKRFCSASRKDDPNYREAVQAIIKNDIDPYDQWFWGEVSGPIERYFKKHGGNPIPNHLVYKFLRKPKKDIIELNEDGVHYKRFLRSTDLEPIEKIMFGFKSQEALDLVMRKIDNYGQFKIDVNDAVEDLHEDDNSSIEIRTFDAAVVFIQELDEKHESGFNEMLPSWKEQLLQSIDRLLKEQKKELTSSKKHLIESNLELAKHLIKRMPLLQFHKFSLNMK